MEDKNAEALTGALQAITVAVSALLATHPEPHLLRSMFERIAAKQPQSHPLYSRTLETLRKAIT